VTRFAYQPFYCEENAFLLVEALDVPKRYALFVTNAARTVAIWRQRLAVSRRGPVVWDYHVVAVTLEPPLVWDLDTTLPVPCPLDEYVACSFRSDGLASPELAPRFRLVPEDELLLGFASDRRHMRDELDRYREPPPPWPLIGSGHTLDQFLDLEDPVAGEVIDGVDALLRRLDSLGHASRRT
jgi:hypothetical protein